MKKKYIKVILNLVLLVILKNIYADSIDTFTTIQAKGTGTIINNDIAMARDRALSDALRNAVEKGIGVLVESESLTENFMMVSDKILKKAKGYVNSYKIISEEHTNDLYQITIEAILGSGQLSEDLQGIGLLLKEMGMPIIMAVISEKNIDKEITLENSVVFNAIFNKFSEKGFKFVDQETIKNVMNREQKNIVALVELSDKELATISSRIGADYNIKGKAIANTSDLGKTLGTKYKGLLSASAQVNLSVINSHTGIIIASASEQGKIWNISQTLAGDNALKKAGEKIADKLIKKILKSWQKSVNSGTEFKLTITGISYSESNDIIEKMDNIIRGLSDITKKDFTGNTANYLIKAKSTADHIATDLSEKDFGYNITIQSVSQNSIIIKAKKKL